jgi:hypothetical protein
MIGFSMTLFPFGQGIGRQGILSGQIWTTDDGKFHAYNFTDDDGNTKYHGKIEKTFSGHRNPIDLMEKIIKDIKST